MARADQDKIDPAVLKSALILIIGALAVVFDTTIVSVALHTLAARLHTCTAPCSCSRSTTSRYAASAR